MTTELVSKAEVLEEIEDTCWSGNLDDRNDLMDRIRALPSPAPDGERLREALEHEQWGVISRAIDRYSVGTISELHALGLIASGFMTLLGVRNAALDRKDTTP